MDMLFRQIARTARFAPVLVTIAAVAGIPSSAAWAQFEDVVEVPAGNRLQPGPFQVSASYFDQSVFGSSSGGQQYRKRLDAMVSLQVDRYDAICQLSPRQKDLLRLAARGDVKRLENTLHTLRAKFNVARFDRHKFSAVQQEMYGLRNKIRNGIVNEPSLLQKVVQGMLDRQQIAKLEQADLERRNAIYRAKIGLFLAQLQNGVPMLAEQRNRFTTLLLEETPAPKKYGSYSYYVVMVKTSRLPEKKVRAIFDDAQWHAIKRSFDQARGMEEHLKQQGILE